MRHAACGMRRLAKTDRRSLLDFRHWRPSMGACRSILMTVGINYYSVGDFERPTIKEIESRKRATNASLSIK